MVKAVSAEAPHAEEWIQARGLQPAGRQTLELDDILAALVETERLGSRRTRAGETVKEREYERAGGREQQR